MVLIPDLRTIQAEMVISNGRIVAEKGRNLVPPVKIPFQDQPEKYPPAGEDGTGRFPCSGKEDNTSPQDKGDKPGRRALTREEQITITPKEGLLEADTDSDILKVAVIETASARGRCSPALSEASA